LPWNTWREAEFKALQSLLLKQKVRYFVTASRTASVCSFLLSIHHRTRPGILPPTSPQHHAHAHTLLAFLFLRLPSSYLQLIQSTHTQHHLLSSFPCIDVGALISIQSSRQNNLVTPSAPAPLFVLQPPASNQLYSSGLVQVCLPDPVLSQKALRNNPAFAPLLRYTSLLITMLTLISSDFPSLQRTQHSTYLIPTASINGKPPHPSLTSSP
jgi:hypothetical protein